MVDIQTVSIVIAACGLFIAAVNSIISSRRAERTREAQLFMQIYTQWTNPEFALSYGNVRYNEEYQWKEVEELQKKAFEPFNPELWTHHHTLSQFFEGIGVLVEMRLIDVNLVRNFFSQRIIWYWEFMKPFVYYRRKRINDPNVFGSLEYLYNEMMKREQQATTST